MDFRLIQQQTQKLVLSPQIQQYLKLLQLPLIELQHTVEQELVENPVLEDGEVQSEDSELDASLEPPIPSEDDSSKEKEEELDFQEKIDMLDKLDEQFKESYHSNFDSKGESIEDLEKKHDFKQSLITKAPTITDYLMWQLTFIDFQDHELKIAEEMIGNISSDGYFRMNLVELSELFNTSVETLESILSALQTLDPPGVFGRELREVLMLQLERTEANNVNKLAYKILDKFFDAFKKRDISSIAKQLHASPELINKATKVIGRLEPKPGRIFYQDENLTVVPDVTIHPPTDTNPEFVIEIHDESVPHLKISNYYKNLIKDKNVDQKTKDYIKQKINAGIWFIKAIEQRKSTLRLITERLVKEQEEFFEKGFAYLKPLTLRDIASEINIHESTVSRALSGKYVSTSQGTIPFKSFFSNKMATTDGDFESQKSIMEKIKNILENEDPKKPLSDAKLVKILDLEGTKIARRTVAKYREMLRILPSHLRKLK
ncbi:RNA polymerase factor sigma-54 [Candidatus Omnitrophota bacterium]